MQDAFGELKEHTKTTDEMKMNTLEIAHRCMCMLKALEIELQRRIKENKEFSLSPLGQLHFMLAKLTVYLWVLAALKSEDVVMEIAKKSEKEVPAEFDEYFAPKGIEHQASGSGTSLNEEK